jgi:complement component 1 Q subcomponent-binding protein, mitochondrial
MLARPTSIQIHKVCEKLGEAKRERFATSTTIVIINADGTHQSEIVSTQLPSLISICSSPLTQESSQNTMRIIHHGAAAAMRRAMVKSLESSAFSGARNGSRHLSSLVVSSSSSLSSSRTTTAAAAAATPMWNDKTNTTPAGNFFTTTTSLTGPRRMFSAQSLVDILAREEQEEVEAGNTELPADLADLQKTLEKDWRIVVGNDDAMVNLFSKVSASPKIQVSFHCQDTVQEEEMGGDEDAEGEEEEEMSPVRFTVTITKAGKTLTFACLSDYGQVKIEGVSTCLSSSPESIHATQGALEKTLYQGPDFMELAEDLQDAMAIYLEEDCRVTSDVAAFVAMYSDYKEQLSYVQFLKTMQSIVA